MRNSLRAVITALVAIPLVCTPISAQAAPSPVPFGSMNGNGVKYPLGEEILIFMCWGTKPQTSLLLKTDGTWAAVAKSTVTRNTKVCGRKFPYRHAYRWSVTGNPDPNGAILIAVSKGSQPSYADVIYTTAPASPSATPATTSAPAPAPAPVVTQAPTWSPNDSRTWTQKEKDFVRYVSEAFSTVSEATRRSNCVGLADPGQDSANRAFYELVADRGVGLFGLTRDHARALPAPLYDRLCYMLYRINTRIL
jgi:hypothetical protein